MDKHQCCQWRGASPCLRQVCISLKLFIFSDLPSPDPSIRPLLELLLPKAATESFQSTQSLLKDLLAFHSREWDCPEGEKQRDKVLYCTHLLHQEHGIRSWEAMLSSCTVLLLPLCQDWPMSNVWLNLLCWCQEQLQANTSDANV